MCGTNFTADSSSFLSSERPFLMCFLTILEHVWKTGFRQPTFGSINRQHICYWANDSNVHSTLFETLEIRKFPSQTSLRLLVSRLLINKILDYVHTVEKDVPKPDFSKKDKRTTVTHLSLVPGLQKLGTKVQDNKFVKIPIRDNQNLPYFPQGQVNLSFY